MNNTHVTYVTRTAFVINRIKLTLYGRRYIFCSIVTSESRSGGTKIHFCSENILVSIQKYNIKKIEPDGSKKIKIMREKTPKEYAQVRRKEEQ